MCQPHGVSRLDYDLFTCLLGEDLETSSGNKQMVDSNQQDWYWRNGRKTDVISIYAFQSNKHTGKGHCHLPDIGFGQQTSAMRHHPN